MNDAKNISRTGVHVTKACELIIDDIHESFASGDADDAWAHLKHMHNVIVRVIQKMTQKITEDDVDAKELFEFAVALALLRTYCKQSGNLDAMREAIRAEHEFELARLREASP